MVLLMQNNFFVPTSPSNRKSKEPPNEGFGDLFTIQKGVGGSYCTLLLSKKKGVGGGGGGCVIMVVVMLKVVVVQTFKM